VNPTRSQNLDGPLMDEWLDVRATNSGSTTELDLSSRRGGEIDPIATTEHLRTAFLRYLKTLHPLRSSDLRAAYWRELERPQAIMKGPLLEGAPPFRTGRSIGDLVEAGVLSREFCSLASPALPLDRPLYLHQDRAIEKIVQGRRNIVIATGTGSGKTESFIIPILDALLREREAGTLGEPGVRALLLYPMNALANDQIQRLRDLLASSPDITFGRYIGETEQTRQAALDRFRKQFPGVEPLTNELLSREEMQQRPPHILLTNYAMLEYLLLRPADSVFFDGDTARHWRFIVLDEAHTYDGATGIEVAMLLRRLKDRVVRSEPGRLQCLATSATLGRGRQDFKRVARFASDLFGEPFEWNETDPDRQDIVEAVREDLEVPPSTELQAFPPAIYGAFRRVHGIADVGKLREIAAQYNVDSRWIAAADEAAARVSSDSAAMVWLGTLLHHDGHLYNLRLLLHTRGPQQLESLASEVFGPGRPGTVQDLVDLVALAASTRKDPSGRTLLPARYHTFVRALEGAYVCFDDHEGKGPRVYLAPHERCPDCEARGRERTVFELASCGRCGAEYVVGSIQPSATSGLENQQHLRTHVQAADEPPTYLLLASHQAVLDEDDAVSESADDVHEDAENYVPSLDTEPGLLCRVCGALAIGDDAQLTCQCGTAGGNTLHVRIVDERVRGASGLRACASCGATTQRDIVSRFVTGQDAPVGVLATHLYEQIPPARDPQLAAKPGAGRKLLIFADSRQDAAFFAPYLNRTHHQLLRRRLIVQVLAAQEDQENLPAIEDMPGWLAPAAEAAGMFDSSQSALERKRETLKWVMAEFVTWDRRNATEGTGLVVFRPRVSREKLVKEGGYPPALTKDPWNLSPDEAIDLLTLLLNTVRQTGAVTYPDGVLATDDIFAPRNRELFIRMSETGRGILSWLPMRHTNRRIELLERLLQRTAPHLTESERHERALHALGGIWRFLTLGASWSQFLRLETHPVEGALFRLDHRLWELAYAGPGAPDAAWYQCDRCGVLSHINLRGLCPTLHCQGTLQPIKSDSPILAENNYRQVYLGLRPVALRAEEHTAQWTSERAAEVQQAFMAGDVNVLSCSTTFELGVDVGELQAVLLRNVPPKTANYVQRAGRAGRRADSAAYILTYAQRRSHDLGFFRQPERMVAGRIVPPAIAIDNPKIVRRHVHSVALAAFFREARERNILHFPLNVGAFFRPEDEVERQGPYLLAQFLAGRPPEVEEALTRIVPLKLHDSVGIKSWAWVDQLVGSGEGILDAVATLIRDDVRVLRQLAKEAMASEKGGLHDHYQRIIRTVLGRDLLGFLGTSNVLPKYSFPTDVVELKTNHIAEPVARQVSLSRDLRLALSDYAPGSALVAGGRVWHSRGIVRHPQRGWDTWHYAVCPQCQSLSRSREPVNCCTVCNEPIDHAYEGLRGQFIVPEFGFIADPDAPPHSGETRPPRIYSSRVYFSHQRSTDPEPTGVAVIVNNEEGYERRMGALIARYSRRGQLSVVNVGPYGRGFRICEQCGYAEPAPPPRQVGSGKHRSRATHPKHINPRTGRECRGYLRSYHLGHTFESDVLAVEFSGIPMTRAEARSVLYALLEGGSRALGIQRDDLDGTLYGADGASQTLILFDDVPGGAGHVRRIGRALREVLDEALEVVRDCSCGAETSCYECLRSFRNQFCHEELSRGAAARVLARVLQA